jgi:hypothetical protein
MNLLHLAPDIQEELLFLPPVTEGRAQVHERMLRPLSAEVCWAVQRGAWREIRETVGVAQFGQDGDTIRGTDTRDRVVVTEEGIG